MQLIAEDHLKSLLFAGCGVTVRPFQEYLISWPSEPAPHPPRSSLKTQNKLSSTRFTNLETLSLCKFQVDQNKRST